MPKLILTMVLAASLLAPVHADDPADQAFKATDLYHVCNDASLTFRSICYGYIRGFLDAVDVALQKVDAGEWCFEDSTVQNIADNYIMFYKIYKHDSKVITESGQGHAVKPLYRSIDWSYSCPEVVQ